VLTPILRSHGFEGHPSRVILSLLHRTDHAVTVQFATRAGTATSGIDYTPVRGTALIPRGRRHATITIPTVHDHVDEDTETFTVRYRAPAGATLSRTRTIVHIVDENADIATVASRSIDEPAHVGAKTPIGAVVTLRGRPLAHPVTLGYEIIPIELTADSSDMTIGSGSLHFAAGQRHRTIPGTVLGDLDDEGDEHFLIVLITARGVYARPGAVITIHDDPGDTPPTVTIGDLSAPEDESGAAQVPLTLSATSERPVTVTYTTAPGTADSRDFVMATGTITIPPYFTTGSVPIALDFDETDEPDQTFTVTISAPVNGTLGAKTTATVTILDDDDPPSVSIGDNTVTEPATSTSMPVTLNRASEKTVTVHPAITGGTAQVGAACGAEQMDPVDIVAPPDGLTLTFPPGTTQQNIDLTACEDTTTESAATVLFGLSDPVNATLGDAAGQLDVLDND